MLFINQSAYYFCLCLQSRDLAWISLGISAIQNENNLHMNSKVGMKILKNLSVYTKPKWEFCKHCLPDCLPHSIAQVDIVHKVC